MNGLVFFVDRLRLLKCIYLCFFSSVFPRVETLTEDIKRVHLVHSVFFCFCFCFLFFLTDTMNRAAFIVLNPPLT